MIFPQLLARCACMLALAASTAQAATIEGFTEPSRKIELSPAESGIITTIDVHEGQSVRKGQRLALLDCDVLYVTLDMAKASMQSRGRLDSARAERDLRALRLSRLEELKTRGHATQDELDRARADLQVAEANLLATIEQHKLDELEYKKTQAMIERRTLRSPIDGVITRIFKEEHEYVAANAPVVLSVVQLDVLRVIFSVPTPLAMTMQVGRDVPLAFSEPDGQAIGRVEAIAPITEAESGTVRVKVLVDNPGGRFRAGVRCTLELPDAPSEPAAPAPSPGS
jgi:RND family efflux transporter MFP subunit